MHETRSTLDDETSVVFPQIYQAAAIEEPLQWFVAAEGGASGPPANHYPMAQLLELCQQDGRLLAGCKVIQLEPAVVCHFYLTGRVQPGSRVVVELKDQVGNVIHHVEETADESGTWRLADAQMLQRAFDDLCFFSVTETAVAWDGSASGGGHQYEYAMPADFMIDKGQIPSFHVGQVIGHVLRPHGHAG